MTAVRVRVADPERLEGRLVRGDLRLDDVERGLVDGRSPAAFSLTRASEVAAARLACCQTRAATPMTAASSGLEGDLGQLEHAERSIR